MPFVPLVVVITLLLLPPTATAWTCAAPPPKLVAVCDQASCPRGNMLVYDLDDDCNLSWQIEELETAGLANLFAWRKQNNPSAVGTIQFTGNGCLLPFFQAKALQGADLNQLCQARPTTASIEDVLQGWREEAAGETSWLYYLLLLVGGFVVALIIWRKRINKAESHDATLTLSPGLQTLLGDTLQANQRTDIGPLLHRLCARDAITNLLQKVGVNPTEITATLSALPSHNIHLNALLEVPARYAAASPDRTVDEVLLFVGMVEMKEPVNLAAFFTRNGLTAAALKSELAKSYRQASANPNIPGPAVYVQNDPFTSAEFVEDCFKQVLKLDAGAARELTMKIHSQGGAVIYQGAQARQVTEELRKLAEAAGQPLKIDLIK